MRNVARDTSDLLLEGAAAPRPLIDGPNGSVRRVDAPRMGGREASSGFSWLPTIGIVCVAVIVMVAMIHLSGA
jgi:hypothetical protein